MKRDEVIRELDNDPSDWMAFFAELWLHRTEVKGRQPYLPSPSEIKWRCEQLRWLESHGFCRAFIVNVMEHENPCFERVKQMIERHGAFETYRRCREFMVETEYDAELFLGENVYDTYRRRIPQVEGQSGGAKSCRRKSGGCP